MFCWCGNKLNRKDMRKYLCGDMVWEWKPYVSFMHIHRHSSYYNLIVLWLLKNNTVIKLISNDMIINWFSNLHSHQWHKRPLLVLLFFGTVLHNRRNSHRHTHTQPYKYKHINDPYDYEHLEEIEPADLYIDKVGRDASHGQYITYHWKNNVS